MDNQDKIFDKFKDAAHNAESKDFPAMEKVWSRLEEKLDKKEDKKTIALWKKIAVAASLLLVISLGSQFLKTDKTPNIETTDKVVTTEIEKAPIDKTDVEKNKDAVFEDSGIVSKTEAEKILNNQVKAKQPVAINEIKISEETIAYGNAAGMPIAVQEIANPAPVITADNISKEEAAEKETAVIGYARAQKNASYKMADSETESKMAKKSAPLVIMNGKAISHNDDVKRDKMMQAELPNFNPENMDSLVILDEPLYIIDGTYYSEDDLFGKNPKSPYAPLNKQDIKTITILQDTEATEKYGEKGKKGVVIITTRKGKPASQE